MHQVELQLEREPRWPNPLQTQLQARRAAPFCYTRAATRSHRVRALKLFYWAGKFTHAAAATWCGQSCFTKNGLRLTDDPPADLPVCGTCEGRARGAGQLESNQIAGRVVIFSPRK